VILEESTQDVVGGKKQDGKTGDAKTFDGKTDTKEDGLHGWAEDVGYNSEVCERSEE